MNYYNEFDAKAAEWIQELINQKLIPPGIVDTRSITDVRADELMGYKQCHFFAGVAGWSKALQLARVDPEEPLWTGSCPCQPFSTAGKRGAVNDERHLWPVFYNLIKECRPPKVIGEQVASSEIVGTELEASFIIAVQSGDFARANRIANKLVKSSVLHYWKRWLDGIHADLATIGYTFRPEVLGAHSVGAPHQRQRLYWGAERVSVALREQTDRTHTPGLHAGIAGNSSTLCISYPTSERCNRRPDTAESSGIAGSEYGCPDNSVAENAAGIGCGGRHNGDSAGQGRQVQTPGLGACGELADIKCKGYKRGIGARQTGAKESSSRHAGECGDNIGVPAVAQGDGCRERLQGHTGNGDDRNKPGRLGTDTARSVTETNSSSNIPLGNSASDNQRGDTLPGINGERLTAGRSGGNDSLSSVPWSKYALVYCRDNKVRRVPIESVLFGMADGLPCGMDIGRADRGFPLCQTSSFEKGQIAVLLKGYGNAIPIYTAAEFISAFNNQEGK